MLKYEFFPKGGGGGPRRTKSVEALFRCPAGIKRKQKLSKEVKRFIGGNGFCTRYKIKKQLFDDGRMTFFQSKEKHLFMIDPDQHLYYMINTGMVKGDTINTKSKQTRYYFIDLEEEQRDSKDRACMIYGEGHQFLSFAACIEKEQYNLFSTLGGCQVPWFVQATMNFDNMIYWFDKLRNNL